MRARLNLTSQSYIGCAYLVLCGYLGLEYSFRVLVRFPRMHGDRLSEPHGVSKLTRKDVPLHVTRRVVIVIVEADLAPPDVARVGHGLKTASCYQSNAQRATRANKKNEMCVHVLLHGVVVEPSFVPVLPN